LKYVEVGRSNVVERLMRLKLCTMKSGDGASNLVLSSYRLIISAATLGLCYIKYLTVEINIFMELALYTKPFEISN